MLYATPASAYETNQTRASFQGTSNRGASPNLGPLPLPSRNNITPENPRKVTNSLGKGTNAPHHLSEKSRNFRTTAFPDHGSCVWFDTTHIRRRTCDNNICQHQQTTLLLFVSVFLSSGLLPRLALYSQVTHNTHNSSLALPCSLSIQG